MKADALPHADGKAKCVPAPCRYGESSSSNPSFLIMMNLPIGVANRQQEETLHYQGPHTQQGACCA